MRPAMKRRPITTMRAGDGTLVEITALPDCKNCYNACALKVRCIDGAGRVIKKCARGVMG